jgi:hypothetical protein
MTKIFEYIKCPICGSRVETKNLTAKETFGIYKKIMGGKSNIQWERKEIGYRAFKRSFLMPLLQKLIDLLSLDNGCDFWPDCLTCERSENDCPDATPYLTQHTKAFDMRAAIRRLHSEGKNYKQIIAELDTSERSIRRALRGK